VPWNYLNNRREIASSERRFLKHNGKSQDGLVSRHLNRPLSRAVTRWLLKLPLVPTAWSALIFVLPIVASFAFLHGTYASFVLGAAIFQLYSILDGCDGEIARSKFLHSEFGRRFDSFCDLIGNVLLAVTLGIGLARHSAAHGFTGSFYILEGIATAVLAVVSEGVVFARRSRAEPIVLSSTRWKGVLYQRHHELIGGSGILVLGEHVAFWLVQLTKRDMAMLAFLLLAIAGWPQWNLHLLLIVSGISSLLACNAFLRQPAALVSEEAS
jgi:phosphatidylglycerophosphate synthase